MSGNDTMYVQKIFCFTFFIPPHFLLDLKKICCVCDVDEKKMKVILYTVVFSQKRDQGLKVLGKVRTEKYSESKVLHYYLLLPPLLHPDIG